MHKYPFVDGSVSSEKSRSDYVGERREFLGKPCLPPWLLAGSVNRNLEVHAIVVVRFASGGKIQIGEENFLSSAVGKVKKRITYDGVVEDVKLVAIFENQHGRWLSGHGVFGR